MRKGSLIALTSVALAVILFLAVNVISNFAFRSARLDLTATNQFTISEGTKNILRNLEEPVRLRYFYSAEMAANFPQIRVYGDRVKDLLLEYAAYAGSNLTLEIIDPKPFTEDEDLAVAEGVAGIPTDTGESLYFGLVGTNSIDGRETIAFFQQEREAFLEYDLTDLIYKLVRIEKPVLGLLTTLPLDVGPGGMMAAMQGQSQPYIIYEQLQQSFDVRMVQTDADRIDEDIKVLALVHPTGLPEHTLYAVDQFVLRGGRVLALVDPLSEMANQPNPMGPMGGPAPGPGTQSDLPELFAAWGIAYDKTKVVGDLAGALRVQSGPGAARPVSDYVVWLGVRNATMNPDELVSADLNLVQIGSGGHIAPAEDATSDFHALIQSTPQSMLYDASEVEGVMDPDNLLVRFKETPEAYTFAARVSGSFASAFPEGAPPKDTLEEDVAVSEVGEEPVPPEPLPPHIETSQTETSLIIVADTDILDDRFWAQEQSLLGQRIVVPIADNASFLINAIESLMGSNDLISLRSRGRDDRPLIAIDRLRQQAETRFLFEQQRLEAQVQETEERLAQLQAQGRGSDDLSAAIILTEEEEQEIARFQSILVDTRKQLRTVQRNLRADVEALQNRVQFVNMALMPALVAIVALIVGVMRRRQRVQAQEARSS